ncbi:MAG: hypothetical protein GX937_02115 [Lentisphaerae bacterium]|jgi:hypothetical protein|nr:hypothetical protein [Lentisphaerota bacterium]
MTKKIACGLFILLAAASLLSAEPIISFEPGENWRERVSAGRTKLEVVAEHAVHGQHSAKVFLPGSPHDTWPGINLKVKPEDFVDGINELNFSAWHQEKETMGINWRIDYDKGDSIFGGTKVPPKTRRRIALVIERKDADGNVSRAVKIVVYRRMPREDCTYWLDDFRLDVASRKFTPIEYIAPKSHRPPTAAEQAAGFQLFQRHWMEHVFKNTKPLPTDGAPILDATACPGEQEPIVFSLHALADLKQVAVTVAKPLTDPNGHALPKTAIEILPIRCLDKKTTYPSKDYYCDLPVLLERRAAVDIPNGESKSFWIDIDVPAQTPAGNYAGTLALAIDGKTATTLPFTLRVLPFTLEEPNDMFWGEYYYGARGTKTPEETKAQLQEHMTIMRKNGMTSIGVCSGPALVKDSARWENGKASFTLDENCNFVLMMNLYFPLGYTMPVILLSDVGQSFCSQFKLAVGSEEYKACYKAFWAAMQAEGKKRGWPEMIVQPVDEPGWQSRHERELNLTLLKYLKEIPGQRTEQDGPADDYFVNQAGPWADMWNFNGGFANADVMARVARENRLATLYNCDVESYRPEVGRYVTGFFQARSNSQGYYNWAFMSGSSNPYDDFDAESGDFSHIYPATATEPGGPSIGWYGVREGIDDYKYLTTLRNLIDRKKNGTPAEQAQAKEAAATIDALLGTLRYSPRVRNAASFTSMNLPDGKRGVTGILKLPNDWSFQHYDQARAILIAQIMTLRGSKPTAATAAPKLAVTPLPPVEAENSAPQSQYQVVVPVINTPVTIDGDLSEPAWQKAGKLENFSIATGGVPLRQTHGRIITDGTYLYLAAVCDEEYMNKIATNVTENGGQVWMDDCVEFFFDPTLEYKGYYQLVVNALGKYTFLNQFNAKKMKPRIKTAAKMGTDSWTVELSIALADLGIPGQSFGFNLCRERRPLEVMELTCWSPTGSSFGTPECFGVANFGRRSLSLTAMDTLQLGDNPITALIRNDLPKAETFTVTAVWNAGAAGETKQTQTIALQPEQEGTVNFTWTAAEPGPVTQTITLLDSKANIIDRLTTTPQVAQPLALALSSPFIDGSDWKAEIAVNLAPERRANLELVIRSDAHGVLARVPLAKDSRFTLTLSQGAFNTRENLAVQLQDKTTGKTISAVNRTVFTP